MSNFKEIAIKIVGLSAVMISAFFAGYGIDYFIRDIS